MPLYLVEVTDPQGRKHLAQRGDGKGLLTSDNCASCCGSGTDCPTIRRYDRCPETAYNAGCQSNPDHVWYCERSDANGGMPTTTKEGNSCYSKTDTTIPTADLPSGDVLLPINGIHVTGCDDPQCTFCEHFYLADPCPGQDLTGLRPVYVPADSVTQCPPGQDCGGFAFTQGNKGACYTVQPGTRYNRADVTANNGIVNYDVSLPCGTFKCCECVSNCATVNVPTYTDCGLGDRTINLSCCCSDTWTATIQVQDTVVNTSALPGSSVIIQIDHYGGSATVTDQMGTPGNPAPTMAGYTLRTIDNVQDYYTTYTVGYPTFSPCAPFLDAIPPPGFCPLGGPFTITDSLGNRQEVVRADTYRTCNTLDISYQYRFWSSDQPSVPRLDHTFTCSIRVAHTGRCGGGCGQASGAPLPPTALALAKARAKAAPLPRAQWPAWAKAVALAAKPGDVGVGSTIARTIPGPISMAVKVLSKGECGCDARREALDIRYPYGGTP